MITRTPEAITLSTETGIWTPPEAWVSSTVMVGLIVMQGDAEVATSEAQIRMTPCTSVFFSAQAACSVRLSSATALLWRLNQDEAETVRSDWVRPVDETTATVVHDVFFGTHRPEAHRAAALHFIFHQLLAGGGTESDAPAPPPHKQSDVDRSEWVDQITAYLQAHMDEAINLELLAQKFACSKASITRAFRMACGETPIRVLARLRLVQAKHMLQNTDLTISQIARATGYQDLAGFSHFFKHHTGQAPSEFRDNCHWLI